MNMNTPIDPYWYWIFWWIFTLLAYAGFIIWWRKEIKVVDRGNLEKFEKLKQYREEQLADVNNDDIDR